MLPKPVLFDAIIVCVVFVDNTWIRTCYYISVTLRAPPGDYFRGFFVQATRDKFPLEAINRPAYGTFQPVDRQSQARRCRAAVGSVGGITHTDNSNKQEVAFDWMPPAGCNLGTVQFV
jgi:hypothetical protein